MVSSKWICKIKHVADGRKDLWLKDSLRKGIDYEETFSPGARYSSIITIMEFASMMKWDLHQLDVKTSFLNGVIEE